jgi:hypothetical protein
MQNARLVSRVFGLMAFSGMMMIFGGCASSVERVDPAKQQAESVVLTVDDLHEFALDVIDNLKESQYLAEVLQANQTLHPAEYPLLYMAKISDRTTTGVDTAPWTNTIREKLTTQIKAFRVLSGAVSLDRNKAPYIFNTTITETIGNAAGKTDYCYTITATITERSTGDGKWSHTKEFRKIRKR